ncbi:ATP-binding protein [Luteimonas sp. A534]
MLAAGGFLAGLAGQVLAHVLLVEPAEITAIWVPGGLLLAFLVLRPPRAWPAFVAGFIAGGTLAFSIRNGMVLVPFVGYLWISACIVSGAHMVRVPPGQQDMLPTIRDLGRFVVVIVIGVSSSCALGFVGLVGLIRDDVPLPRLWMLSSAAYAVGFMLITPLAVGIARSGLPPWRGIRSSALTFLLLTVILWVVSILVWHGVPANVSSLPLLLFAPVPLLMLAAFQFGRLGPSMGLAVAFIPAIIISVALDRVDMFETDLINSYIMQMWALASGVLVHALAIQARERNEMLERLLAQGKKNRSLAARIIQNQEEQSVRISRELHDGVNQKLTLYSIALSTVAGRVPAEVRPTLEDMRRSIRELMDEVRNISHNLHPAVLEHAGLPGGIDELARSAEGCWGGTVLVRSQIDPSATRLGPEQTLCMYRVAQESVRNAMEHSGADVISIVLLARGAQWRLHLTDNGCGFDVDAASAASAGRGLGLVSMKERVTAVDGRFRIRSRPGKGTCVSVELRA